MDAPQSKAPKKISQRERPRRRWSLAIALPLWVLVSFGVAQVILIGIVYGLNWLGTPFELVSGTVLQTVIAAAVYALSLAIAIGVPWIIKKRPVNKDDLGLSRLPAWMDILLAPAGFVVYFIVSASLIFLLSQFVPAFDVTQTQEIGFDNLTQRYEYLLAFLTLVVIAPLAEEALFRGYLYGKLRKHIPIWVAALITSVLFGAVHGQLNVAVDTFALSMVMCGLREVTGSIWTGVLLHMLKNGLAFYLLFINPTLISTMGVL